MYEMHVEGDRHLYADGAATVVFIDLAKQKPRRIPDTMRERLLNATAAR
jgi:acyl-CoA thioesterase FadM